MSRRYKEGANRQQNNLLPPALEDYVLADNPVRAIDAFVDCLDVSALGYTNTRIHGDQGGQAAFPPSSLLKLYLYGYLNHVRSSRKLAREAVRNLELIWLLEDLKPSYKTIANFRKDNAKALKATHREFILLCKSLALFGGETVAIDGSFFNGNASNGSIQTKEQLKKELKKLDNHIAEYQKQMDECDQQERGKGVVTPVSDGQLVEKLMALKERQSLRQEQIKTLDESGETQISNTDTDARMLSKNGKVVTGFNVQIAVDDKHKLIVADEVTNDGNDSDLLSSMAIAAKETLGVDTLDVLADAGYYEGDNLKTCEENGIIAFVAISTKDYATEENERYRRHDFQYDKEQDCYICPQGQSLNAVGDWKNKRGKLQQVYISKKTICAQCPIKIRCLGKKSQRREIMRWEHEDVLDRHRQRMIENPSRMRERGGIVEHLFGTLKRRAGWDHFLVRGFEKVRGEWSIMALCYNLSRVINILGLDALQEIFAQRRAEMQKNVAMA